jgi:4'-phosphopantetheinyl transferase
VRRELPAHGIRSFRGLASEAIELTRDRIDVWLIQTRIASAIANDLSQLLSPEETTRAARFRFEHLRCAFIATRAALRFLLGLYLQIEPALVQICYGKHGKPYLAIAESIAFNVSHSGDLAALAFGVGGDIGVDVECLRPVPEISALVRRFLSCTEVDHLLSLPREEQQSFFFRYWTCKESFVKAVGTGLSTPLDSFDVILYSDQLPGVVELAPNEGWTIVELDLPNGFAGSLAYRGKGKHLRIFPLASWSGSLG